jgi:diguanylate cyclase (GGDEF)-like protein/PAS domain S-box-containing protein
VTRQPVGPPEAAAGTLTPWHLLGAMLLTGTAYFAFARLGLLIPYVGTHISLVWLPTGVALAACWRWGPVMAPAIWLAACAANLGLAGPAWVAIGIAAGNTLGPWFSAWLLRRWCFDSTLVRRRDLGLYLAAVLLGMVITASNGTAWLVAGGALGAELWLPAWVSWWVGDAVGALLGGVPLVALDRRALMSAFLGRRGPGNLLLLLGVAACSLLTFSGLLAPGSALLLPLLALPLFLGAVLALRCGALATSLAALIVAGAAAWGTARGVGPFAGFDPHAGLLALWSYISAQACAGLLIWVVGAELLSSRRQFEALFEHAAEALIVLAPGDRLQAMNPAACQLLGVAAAQAQGLPLQALPHGHGQVLAAGLAHWRSSEAGRAPLDIGLHRPDGHSIALELLAASYHDAGGQSHTHLVLRDVSARRDAEARLQRSEHSLRSIADNMPVLICYLDRDHRYRFANATYRDWFGIEPEHLIGKRVDELFPPALYEARRPYMEQAMRGGERVSYEMEVDIRGWRRHLRTTYVPDRATDGSVQGLYVLIQDITESKAVEDRLSRMARFDHLTGLMNRQPFEDRLGEAVRNLRRGSGALALLFIDVDHFKAINDSRGHATGDAVLKEFARRLQQAVRSNDAVARLAGDEFVVLLERVRDPEQAEAVAAKVCAEMQPAFALADGPLAVTASVGVAWCDGAQLRTSEQVMAAADDALYEAKRAGRNTWRLHRCAAPQFDDSR